MIEPSDERLARRGAQGARRAFEAIYRRYHQGLYRFCLAMLGSPHDAQDTLQNTMVKVLRALPGEQRQIKLKPWLYRIARNEAVETLRRRRDRIEPEPEQAAPSAAQIAERAEDRERLRQLFADLELLPDRQRGALVMRELSGLSFAEIASAFETSAATARQTVYEARKSLQQMEEGREMRCEVVTQALSEADGRSRRRRELRAHLRNCAECRAFAEGIDGRRTELAALAPLPLAASAGILQGVLAGQANGALAGSVAGSSSGPVAAGAGKAIATSAIAKSAATVAVVTVVGVSAAGRTDLVDVPLIDRGGKASEAASGSNAAPGATRADWATPQGGARHNERRLLGLSAAATARARSHPAVDPPSHATKPPGGAAGGAGLPAVVGPPESSSRGRALGRAGAKKARPPKGPAAASSHGQQTAAAHKSPQGNSSPGSGPRSPKPVQSQAPAAPPGREKEAGGEPGHGPSEATETQGTLEQTASGKHGPDGDGDGPFQP
jgi:RNA polymerase sigma factor (sigma-70 family)